MRQSYYDIYYQKEMFSQKVLHAEEKRRLHDTAAMIPQDVNSILDVGCGEGVLLNFLHASNKHYERLVGMDISESALLHILTERKAGSIEQIPFSNREFDLVSALEVLEHVPYPNFLNSLKELQRVAKNYILLSVPNNEKITDKFVICPQCGCHFNIDHHVRSFSYKFIPELFEEFTLKTMTFSGETTRYLGQRKLRRLGMFVGAINPFPEHAVCAQCDYHLPSVKENDIPPINTSTASHQGIKNVIKILIPAKKTPRWMIALYQRKNEPIL